MDLRLVTGNPGKLREMRELLRPYGVRVRAVHRSLSEPQAETLEEVVRAKLAATRQLAGPVLVEDSGLFIRSLHGFPGVYSSHIYRIWRFGPILELLRRRPRAATFRTVAGLRFGSQIRLFVGECTGRIVSSPRGSHGFGFDPIFSPQGSGRTFAEMDPLEKGRHSHRGEAMRAVGKFLASRGSHR